MAMTLDRARTEVADVAQSLADRLDRVDLVTPTVQGLGRASESATGLATDVGRRAKKRARQAVPDVGGIAKRTTAHRTRTLVLTALAALLAVNVGVALVARRRKQQRAMEQPYDDRYQSNGATSLGEPVPVGEPDRL